VGRLFFITENKKVIVGVLYDVFYVNQIIVDLILMAYVLSQFYTYFHISLAMLCFQVDL